MDSTATYVYCLVQRDRRPTVTGVPPGVPHGTAPEVSEVAPRLWLVSAEVPLPAYSSEQIQHHLQDLEWVSRTALAHEAVVEHFGRVAGATVMPMKLFTLFSGRPRAVAEMAKRRAELEGVAARIRESAEWGVRIARHSAAPDDGGFHDGRTRSGTAFLAAKKRARDEARQRAREATEAAEHALAALAGIARQVRRQPAPDGASAPPLLDAAFLVASNRVARFKAAARREAERCRKAGAELTLTGPWPAYNFIQPEDLST